MTRKLILLFILYLGITLPLFAETVVLKSGKKVDGRIIEKTDKYIKLDLDGISLTYYTEDIESVNGVNPGAETIQKVINQSSSDTVDTEHIRRILKDLRYPEITWQDIERELTTFLAKIDFAQLKSRAQRIKTDPSQLKDFIAEIGRLIDKERHNYKEPAPLLAILINSLSKDDISSVIETSPASPEEKDKRKRVLFQCSALSQLGSIILNLLDIEAKVGFTPEHVFNYISLNKNEVLFIDFTNQIFATIDISEYYKIYGNYLTLKPEQYLSPDNVMLIMSKLQKGQRDLGQKEILNALFTTVFLSNSFSATASIYGNFGLAYALKGNPAQAIDNYNKALMINPYDAERYSDRGLVYYSQGKLDQAIADYNRALEINPNLVQAYSNRGIIYFDEGDINKAIDEYNKALEIKPNDITAYNNRGNAYAKRGNFEQAIADYNKAVDIDAFYPDAYYNRAVAYFLKGDYEKAWEDVYRAKVLNYLISSEFLQSLRQASGREN